MTILNRAQEIVSKGMNQDDVSAFLDVIYNKLGKSPLEMELLLVAAGASERKALDAVELWQLG